MAIVLMTATPMVALTQTTATQAADSLKTIVVKVKGITCATDTKMIATNVEKRPGVSSCIVKKQGPTTHFEVQYTPALVEEQDIYDTIENTGSCDHPDERPYKVKRKSA